MATKETATGNDCYARLQPDEPYFLLMARDPDFEIVVQIWAMLRRMQIRNGSRPDTPLEHAQISEAFLCSTEGRIWGEQYRARKDRERYVMGEPDATGGAHPVSCDGVPIELGRKGS